MRPSLALWTILGTDKNPHDGHAHANVHAFSNHVLLFTFGKEQERSEANWVPPAGQRIFDEQFPEVDIHPKRAVFGLVLLSVSSSGDQLGRRALHGCVSRVQMHC